MRMQHEVVPVSISDEDMRESEVVVPICVGPIEQIARTCEVLDRSTQRRTEYIVVRYWFDGFQTRALLRRRCEH